MRSASVVTRWQPLTGPAQIKTYGRIFVENGSRSRSSRSTERSGKMAAFKGCSSALGFRTPDRACSHRRWPWTKWHLDECSTKQASKRLAGRSIKPADVQRIGLPLVVKPSREGSSVGISIVRDETRIEPALHLAQRLHGVVLLEEFVAGREIEVAILDGEVLGDVEVRPATEFYDYAAKYQRSDTQYMVPAPLTAAERQLCHDLARRAHAALGCAGVTRTDLLLSPTGRAVCLEVDTLPGLTDRSLVPKIAQHAGLDFASLCERILATAALKA